MDPWNNLKSIPHLFRKIVHTLFKSYLCLDLSIVVYALGCLRLVKEHLNWGSKSELKAEVLRGIKEIGSVLYWMGLLDIVLVSFLH